MVVVELVLAVLVIEALLVLDVVMVANEDEVDVAVDGDDEVLELMLVVLAVLAVVPVVVLDDVRDGVVVLVVDTVRDDVEVEVAVDELAVDELK